MMVSTLPRFAIPMRNVMSPTLVTVKCAGRDRSTGRTGSEAQMVVSTITGGVVGAGACGRPWTNELYPLSTMTISMTARFIYCTQAKDGVYRVGSCKRTCNIDLYYAKKTKIPFLLQV
jgi:hypothetical protein